MLNITKWELLKFWWNPIDFLDSKRGQYLLSVWSRKVRGRDKKCLRCGSTAFLEAHHIRPKKENPRYGYSLNNGVTLCKRCHTVSKISYHSVFGDSGSPKMFNMWLRLYPSGAKREQKQ